MREAQSASPRTGASPGVDFEAIFRDAPNPYVLMDTDLRIVDMNEAYLRATNSERERIIGQNLFTAFPDGDDSPNSAGTAQVRNSLLRAIEERRTDHLAFVEYAIAGPNGFDRRYWSATHVPIMGPDGEVAFVLQNTMDVTELAQLRAESAMLSPDRRAVAVLDRARAVQAANRSLWEERTHLRRLFHEAPGFMAVLRGPDHVFELANEAYLRLVGRDEIVGKPLRLALPEVVEQGFVQLLDETAASGKPFVGRGVRVLLTPRHAGPPEERFLDFVYQPVTDADGAVVAIFVQGHDITEQKRAEAALRDLAVTLEDRVAQRTSELESAQRALQSVNANLENIVTARMSDLRAANEEIQRFAYIVSHDLRSPLVNVMGFASELDDIRQIIADHLARDEAPLPEAVRTAVEHDLPEALSFIRSSSERMDRLINAILKLSREGRRTLSPEPLSLRRLLTDLANGLSHRADSVGATMSVAELPDIVSDRIAVEQVFGNLLDNALKYLSADRPGQITVRGWDDGPNVRIAVLDNGRGIDPRDFERIFDLFRRAGVQNVAGEGIGLAHVRALVRRLGGVVSVSSEPGEGSTFIVTLPKVLTLQANQELT